MRINKLNQQGQLSPVLLHHGTTQHLFAHFIGKIVEFAACVGTIADDALPLRKRTNLPALAYWHIGRGQTLPLQEPAAAPHHLTEVGLKKKRIQRFHLFYLVVLNLYFYWRQAASLPGYLALGRS